MPLEKGTSREVIHRNIEEMVEHGHPVKQAVAAALHTAHPGGGKDNSLAEEAEKKRVIISHDEPYAKPVTAMTQADLNERNKSFWAMPGGMGPAESEASAVPLAGTKVAPVPVYHDGRAEPAEGEYEEMHSETADDKDEVKPTQSDPPDDRSDNLLGSPAIAGDESLVEWAKEEEKEKEHKSEDEHLGFAKLENKLAHKSGIRNPAAVAAAIGRKKYGEAGMAKKSAEGRK